MFVCDIETAKIPRINTINHLAIFLVDGRREPHQMRFESNVCATYAFLLFTKLKIFAIFFFFEFIFRLKKMSRYIVNRQRISNFYLAFTYS